MLQGCFNVSIVYYYIYNVSEIIFFEMFLQCRILQHYKHAQFLRDFSQLINENRMYIYIFLFYINFLSTKLT